MNVDKVLATTFAEHEHLAPDAEAVLADLRRAIQPQQRHSHPSWLTAVGAAAAVAVIAVGTTVLVNRAQHSSPAAPPLPPHVLTLTDKVGRVGVPYGGRFVDRQHGFVALRRCEYSTLSPAESVDPRFQNICTYVLEVTTDGGATFQGRSLPMPPQLDLGFVSSLIVFDATHLAVNQMAATADGKDFPAARWISSDAGATWTKVSLQQGGPVSQIPAGAQLLSSAPDATSGPPWVMTPDGVAHPLTLPNTMPEDIGRYSAAPWWATTRAGGSYFLYEEDPTSNAGAALAVSRDNARTWQPVHLPTGVFQASFMGFDGQWLYGRASTAESQFDVIIASKDGGQTWQRLTLPKAKPQDGMGYAVAPDGGLLFDDGSHLWRANG